MNRTRLLRWARRYGQLIVAWEAVNAPVLAGIAGAHDSVRTPSFTVHRTPQTTLVVHRVGPGAIDNDIGALIAEQLVAPGLVAGVGAFERCFAGLVESTGPSPPGCWRRFYLNSLSALRDRGGGRAGGPIATFRGIYGHAERLVQGADLLDVGSCFAFFPMLLAATGKRRVTASDRDPPTVALGRRFARELGLTVDFWIADVTGPLPFGASSFDTVTALHLLEHLPERSTAPVLTSLCGLARRRVVVAVPVEAAPDPTYGHLQTFDLDRLEAIANDIEGWRGAAHEYLGGWLVLEPRRRRRPRPSLVEGSAAAPEALAAACARGPGTLDADPRPGTEISPLPHGFDSRFAKCPGQERSG
jgi:hypothetical protein